MIDSGGDNGSPLDVEALLRQAMGGGAGDGRFGIKTGSAGLNGDVGLRPGPEEGQLPVKPSFSVPTAGNTPDDDRPTLGARIAGDVPKPQPAPAPADATPAQPAIPFDPSKIPDSIRPRTMPAPSEVARPPVGVNNQKRLDLMARQEQLDVPTNPDAIDPTTGKPKYKMGWGQRVLGTVANFASGFGGRGGDPVYVGPGATNWKFGRAENLRKENLAGVRSELENQDKLEQSQEKSYADVMKAAYETQSAEARNRTSLAQQETADVRKELSTSQIAKNEADAELKRTKAGQEPEPRTEPEIALALQTAQLKGDKQGVLKYKGALQELAKQKIAGRPEKDTSAADVQKALMAAEFRSREHDKVNTDYEKERRDRTEEFANTPAGKIDYNGKKLAAFSASLKQELDAKYAARHQGIDTEADKMLGLTKAGAALKTGATLSPPAAKSSQPIAAPLKPTQPAPAGRAWVFDLKTGKRGTIPLSQLKSATSGPNAQYGTW